MENQDSKGTITAAKWSAIGVIGAAAIALLLPFIKHVVAEKAPIPPPDAKVTQPSPQVSIPSQTIQISPGQGGQANVNPGSGSFVVNNNMAPVSDHPVTSGVGLKWTADDFGEAVRSGNIPAIKEYLSLKDGFDPNSLNGAAFVLQLPIIDGTQDFPAILKLFKDTGKLDWMTKNPGSFFGPKYGHAISMQWGLFQEAAANKNDASDVKALIDAGADPTEFIADEIKTFNAPAHGVLIYQGVLTGRMRDSDGSTAEQALAIFKNLGYAMPNLQQAIVESSKTGAACEQDVKAHHSLQEAMDLARRPPQASPGGQGMTWQSFQQAVAYLRERLRAGPPSAGTTYDDEYALAIARACSPNGRL